MIDIRDPGGVLTTIKDASRRFEKGGPVPNATRDLLVELADALADSGPLELGISAGQWLWARGNALRAVGSLKDDRVEAQVRGAKQGLRTARRVFRLAVWSAGWRKHFGESRRALRIQFAALWLLGTLVVVLAETLLQPAGFRLIYFLVAPVVLIPIWAILFRDAAARLIDRALAREAARVVAASQRALLLVRLANDELLIATDQQVLRAGRLVHKRWGLTWSAPYTQIAFSAPDEDAKSPHVRLRVRGEQRVFDCREISAGENRSDYQRKLRKALAMILGRRTQPERGEAVSSVRRGTR